MIVYIITEPYFCVVFSIAFGTTSSLCQYHFAFNDSLLLLMNSTYDLQIIINYIFQGNYF